MYRARLVGRRRPPARQAIGSRARRERENNDRPSLCTGVRRQVIL
ncbi:Hypothetical protein ETEE_1237 [Edwardsiella anguillarum ET080813]|uniref:Uncharacterized protein n=1 Tax=Edwardsiella anguillarum ET080813 TaxID=667120 RepID=A0A076LGL5_9GAMM|nr:Hypothetical protein ETEE_1237 [Edwardsiella anguillarum ET080813]